MCDYTEDFCCEIFSAKIKTRSREALGLLNIFDSFYNDFVCLVNALGKLTEIRGGQIRSAHFDNKVIRKSFYFGCKVGRIKLLEITWTVLNREKFQASMYLRMCC